ncbi:MAG: 16S rRNA (cytosine(1402)-N(4))-methyltransferase RsmH [Candidatus Coatesbacteria bacterium]|nr:16S rRNA (cytosine(1402)-N(4))-methyltransferase RsmH [Candidatus Coatesbacteria bacterium]
MRGLLGDIHRPVLVAEVLDNLRFVSEGGIFVDATLGFGGHAIAVLEHFPNSTVVGIEIDDETISLCRKRLAPYGDRCRAIRGTYGDLGDLLSLAGIAAVDTILMDTGVSSFDIDTPERGFSFSLDGPLDMRYRQEFGLETAEAIINHENASYLRRIMRDYGEVPFAGRIASAICSRRVNSPIATTLQLVEVVRRAVGGRIGRMKLEGLLAQVFQAFRVAVNRELEVLEAGLRQGIDHLESGGRLLVICYESLSHNLTKRVFREYERGCICPKEVPVCVCGRSPKARILTRRAISPSAAEIADNIRSRSAGMRIIERL